MWALWLTWLYMATLRRGEQMPRVCDGRETEDERRKRMETLAEEIWVTCDTVCGVWLVAVMLWICFELVSI